MSGPQVEFTGGGVLVGVGLIVGGLLAWTAYKKGAGLISGAVQTVTDSTKEAAWAVTPWNNDNVIYGGVNSAGAAITGNKDFSLGGWIYEVINPEPAPVPPKAPIQSGGGGIFNGNGASGSW